MSQIRVAFGATCKPLCQQVGVKNDDIDRLQLLADAITRLRIAGVLSESQCHSARNKLGKQIGKAVSRALDEDETRAAAAMAKEQGE
jgi:hypothetical protein